MTEAEAIAAVEAAEAKVSALQTEHATLIQSGIEKRKQLALLKQEIEDIHSQVSAIQRDQWGRNGFWHVGTLPDAMRQLEHAKTALMHARSQKIQGVPVLSAFGYGRKTEKNYILLYPSGEFMVNRTTGKVRGAVGFWRNLDQAELAALDAFVASLESK